MATYREHFEQAIKSAREELDRAEKLIDKDGDLWNAKMSLDNASKNVEYASRTLVGVSVISLDKTFDQRVVGDYIP